MNLEPETPRPGSGPRAYLITISCYGHRLHGDPHGAVDRFHNQPGARFLDPDPVRLETELRLMGQPSYELDAKRRPIALSAIQKLCSYREWHLHAAHVRLNHIHAVISADCKPERVMNDLKVYVSRALGKTGWDPESRRRWSRHGSTKYLWNDEHLLNATSYVLNGQGEPMETYRDPNPPRR